MDVRNLRAFVEVVRQDGFSAAAKVIHATQSTVSKAVRRLEAEIGAPLLDRIGHRSTLTPVGEVVYRRAVRMLAEREDLLAELDDLRGLKRGTLRLGLPPVGSSTLFAPLFAIYRQRYPDVEIRLVEHGSDRLEEILRAGEIELAALLMPAAAPFHWQAVRSEPMSVLLPIAQARPRRRTTDLAALKDLPFVLFEEGFAINRMILDICRRQGFEPKVIARSSQIDFIVELVSAGLGIAFLPRMIALAQARPSIHQVQLLEPGTQWQLAMMWRRESYLSHAARAWLQILAHHHSPKLRA
jgi:DNA-binding transcriptional LysR family regulator